MTFNKWYLAAILPCFLACKSTANKQDVQPNVVFFLIDDQRNTTLGCNGDTIVQMPVVDKLAEQGVRFENAFVSTSICMASRATIFSGLVTRTHGVPNYITPMDTVYAQEVYPKVLKQAGYNVGFIGKFGFNLADGQDRASWFDYYQQFDQPLMKTLPDGSKKHETTMAGEYAMEFINSQTKDKPFCLQVSFNAAHAVDKDLRPGIGHFTWMPELDGLYEDVTFPEPRLGDTTIFNNLPEFLQTSLNRTRYFWRWDTPEKYQINMRAYYRLLTGIDLTIGRVQDLLKERGLDKNTIIIYMADNGYYMGDRGFAGKWSHYEQSLRVPLIIYDPRLPEGKRKRVLDNLALNLDIPSTILDYCGVTQPASYQGSSLKPLVEGEEVPWRQSFFCESLHPAPIIPKWEGVRRENLVYARYSGQNPPYEFLHDLEKDPDQLINFAKDEAYSDILQSMRLECDNYLKQYEAERK